PVPSCAIVEFKAAPGDDSLKQGLRVARGTALRPPLGKGGRTACEFRTAHEVTLWPLEVTEARYISGAGALSTLAVSGATGARAAIRLKLKTQGGIGFDKLPIERLVFFIKAGGDIGAKIHEQVSANALGLALRPTGGSALQQCPASAIREVGFADSEALLPPGRADFAGYRLLREYFALPERYLFFALADLTAALATIKAEEIELFILLDRAQAALENQLDAAQFRLGCTPVINLFPRGIDRLHISPRQTEHHLVPDRNRPQDFEIFALESVSAISSGAETAIPVHPVYSVGYHSAAPGTGLFYSVQRRPRVYSSNQARTGNRTSYMGSEWFLSLTGNPDLLQQIQQLDARALCTNRDLPIQLALGGGRSDFLVEGAAMVESVRCLSSPTYPRPAPAFGDSAWKLISHLSLNYLSLLDSDPVTGAALLRDMLQLYADPGNPAVARQIEGVRSIAHEAVVRRLPMPGPITYGRGLRISLTLEEAAFEGTGMMILGSVLERFFAAYVTINSFTQTRILSLTRGEVKEWPPRLGRRQLI
ncbi:MAG TPA: type VI secretion system baseplate subunit TssF, partial [Steroidobacteraceae bacterium]|nr:type VI secretion system baseplate subunit TssF [Steroidobacteraceae bacterium]